MTRLSDVFRARQTDARRVERALGEGFSVHMHSDTEMPEWLWALEPCVHFNVHLKAGSIFCIRDAMFQIGSRSYYGSDL